MRDALQLCPNDHPPFAEVCAGHAGALGLLGYRARTVFFEARGLGNPPEQFEFEHAPVDGLPTLLRGIKPELIVSHRYRAYQAGTWLARRLSIGTHIAVAHEFGMFNRFARRLRRRLAGPGHARFAGVSEPVAEDLRRSGIDAPLVLPNTVDTGAIRAGLRPRAKARAALGIPAAAFAIGVVGRLHPKKDPARALRAFERYRGPDATSRLVFVGDGAMRSELERLAGDDVVFAGFRADVRSLLGAFDVVLACATEHEAFGLGLLEAMAAGVPVVVADRPGPRTVVGDCGVYFETDNDLVAALRRTRSSDPASYRESAMDRALAMFSVAALAQRYRAILIASP